MTELLATLVPILGRALLQFVWQGLVIGVFAAVALSLLHNARPQTRYAVACMAMLACVIVPMITVVLQMTAAPIAASTSITAASGSTAPMALAFADVAALPARFDIMLSNNTLPMIVALWAAGASVFALRMTLGLAWIRRLHAPPQGPAHAVWQARLDVLAARFGIAQPVVLRLVDTLGTPASAGWRRPVVLLPTALLARMPVEWIEALLAHELAHIRRHDYLVNLLQGVVEALLFYHPVTWWLTRRIRIERELIADQLAARATGAPHRLAMALSELADHASASPHCPASLHLVQAANGGHLMSRIQHLIRPRQRSINGRIVFPLLGIAATCIALYAHTQIAPPQASAAAEPATTMPAPLAKAGPVLQPFARPQAAQAQMTRIHDDDDDTRDAFALVRKDRAGITMSGSTDDIDDIKAARATIDRDFLWFRRDKQAYVVTDPATVARAQAAWREVDKLSPPMEALSARMEVHGDKLEVLSEKMEQLSARHASTPAMDAAARQMEQLGPRQQALAAQQMRLAADMAEADPARQEQLQSQMDQLSTQMDRLSREMEQHAGVLEAETEQLDRDTAPMEALSRQMEEASQPMEVLSQQMEALAKQQEPHVKRAEVELQRLISDALARGLATPTPRGVIRR